MRALCTSAAILAIVALATTSSAVSLDVDFEVEPHRENHELEYDFQEPRLNPKAAAFRVKNLEQEAAMPAGGKKTSAGKKGATASTPGGTKFHHFLKYNRLPSGQPLSYSIEPTDYFKEVPDSEKLHHYNKSYYVPYCSTPTMNVSANYTEMDNYMFQTEEFITALGLDIYDAAMWTIAMGLLGDTEIGANYTKVYLDADADDQFLDIRGDKACQGVMAWDQCTDPHQDGVCGLCYGLNATSLTKGNAFFFRIISSYWSIENTVDARCPQRHLPWTWNDYRPILGENAWAQLTGPAQNAIMVAKYDPTAVPDTASIFNLGIPMLHALEVMRVGDTGGIFFEPWNTWAGFSKAAQDTAESFSIENQGSTLGGLRNLHWLIKSNPNSAHAAQLPRIESLMAGLQKILLSSWYQNGTSSFFQQGGFYNHTTDKLTWNRGTGGPGFAVDCQTWVASVLGVKVVDGAFGELASYNLWQTVKALAGYYEDGYLYGVGYTYNSYNGPVFSGEWTYGAINWLRTMVNQSDYNSTIIASLQNDITNMEYGLETSLVTSQYVDNSTAKYHSVNYANKRYYIPFGWWANHIPALCSTSWAVAIANHYNPFSCEKGGYNHLGTFDQELLVDIEGLDSTTPGKPLKVEYNAATKASLKNIAQGKPANWVQYQKKKN